MVLHENQQRILQALHSALGELDMRDHLTIVGSLGRLLAGQETRVGDIDVLIDRELCERYWQFVEKLVQNGIVSVFDVFDRPAFRWGSCLHSIAHARAFTVDCEAHVRGEKHANLDVLFRSADVRLIPRSSQWVWRLEPSDPRLHDSRRTATIIEGHRRMMEDIISGDKKIPKNRAFHEETGFHYGF